MSIKDEIERIGNNVSDALAATAEMGATVPDGANSNNLGTLIRSIPTGGGGVIIINASGTERDTLSILTVNPTTGTKYTAAEIDELAQTKEVVLKTKNVRVEGTREGVFRYYRSVKSGGELAHVEFTGHYKDLKLGKWVPATVKIGTDNLVVIEDEAWKSDGSSGGGGTSIDVTASVGQTIVVKEVDATGKPTAWEAVDHQPRTHWTEKAEILPETAMYSEDGDFAFQGEFTFVDGNSYTVNYNGVDYVTVCRFATMEGENAYFFGNFDAFAGEGDSGEPFIIFYVPAACIGLVLPFDDVSDNTVTISISGEKYNKIPQEYLPVLAVSAGSADGSVRTVLAKPEYGEYVIGQGAFSEGYDTMASGYASHAEGFNTTASGDSSHAEGTATMASGDFSHAEGSNTTASGDFSHAEGINTTASGDRSHAEGSNTTASGYASHAEGFNTTASGDISHVQGKYNIEDLAQKYAHIVGNGVSDAERSNAHTLDWDGNAWFAGGIELNSPNGTRYRITVTDSGTLSVVTVQ